MISETLRTNIGSIVTVEFTDGEIIDARIISVDTEEHWDLVYELVQVRVPSRATQYQLGALFRASLTDVKRVEAA